jgi:hypothetical protein
VILNGTFKIKVATNTEPEPELLALRSGHHYEEDMYWCHQLFFDDWQPGMGYIEELSDGISQISIP